jgi:CubicO group peptidase (beta-lactamase class C family)
MIVEIAARMPFEDYLRKELLKPAKMNHTGFWGFENKKANLASFATGSNTTTVDSTIYKAGRTVPNWGWRGPAGLYSTTDDIYRWILALVNNKVLNEASREQLWGKQVLIAQVSPTEDAYYGYGWGLRFRNGRRFNVRHLGADTFTGHNGAMARYANGDTFVILSNSGAKEGTEWSLLIARSMYKRFDK